MLYFQYRWILSSSGTIQVIGSNILRPAAPAWTNIGQKLPEHIIRNSDQALVSSIKGNGIRIVTHTYTIDYNY